MTEATQQSTGLRSRIFAAWRRISPGLVPLMAVMTAFLIGIPFMVFTGGKGNLAEAHPRPGRFPAFGVRDGRRDGLLEAGA